MSTRVERAPGAPAIRELPAATVAVVRTVGNPSQVGRGALRALYASVYTLEHQRRRHGGGFAVGPPRARWPNVHEAPPSEWVGLWALPVPDDVAALPQLDMRHAVELERWQYGTVAEILHVGPFDAEAETVEQLRRFAREAGFELAGPHEEEYLTKPEERERRTLIRYRVRATA